MLPAPSWPLAKCLPRMANRLPRKSVRVGARAVASAGRVLPLLALIGGAALAVASLPLPAMAQNASAGDAPASVATTVAPAVSDGPLVLERQGSFFVGGRNLHSSTLSLLPAYEAAGTVTVDQMYVRYQIPANAGQRYPITFIHGCCLTGKTWETTPDGRMGWDEYFVRAGYPVYVIDQSWRGRSATDISGINAVRSGKAPVESLPSVFAAGHEGAWAIFRFGKKYPEVFPGMQFPLEAQDEFWKQMVPDWLNAAPKPNPTLPALSELSQKLQGNILISHSQSGIYPFQTAALNRAGIAAIVSIEPGACPAADGDMKPYAGLPMLVLFGDYVDQSPRWAPRLVACKQFVAAANAAGAKAELVLLPEIGIHGNSHMLMQDKNSLEIAHWLDGWLRQHVRTRP